MKDLEETFKELKKKGEGAFIPFITLGDPEPEFTLHLAKAVLENGADILELGIPFSDPVADGPTIQASSERALRSGMNPEFAFTLTEKIRRSTDKSLVFLSYYNIVLQYGVDAFFREMEDVGVQGIIIPDLPIEESSQVLKVAEAHNRDLIFLVSPTTTDVRLKRILVVARGFIYLVSLLGVTGARGTLQEITTKTIGRVKNQILKEIPIAVGFGISKPSHVREVIRAGADGAIVGSAIIDLLAKNLEDREMALQAISTYTREMKNATKLK